ncbi:Ldh family oxidoreductase [Actinomadura scrupuli]|uniref:Ldh family oxidoreductase n=1 Tax=Actinomadura scrupuli TaxID=559629 RepID=UPI003D95F963
MTQTTTATRSEVVRVDHDELIAFTTGVFEALGVPGERARAAADALCHGDLTGVTSHGLTNLTRLYLKLFEDGRVKPDAEPRIVTDRGAAVLLDADRGLGLWVASEAMALATERASRYGVGLVSVFDSTHIGCAGYHAARAVPQGMIGLIASNCGHQRIIRPPGGAVPMLGTNPFSIASPAGAHHPYVLDMSTTVVPTGRVRAAARAGVPAPEGWLEDDHGDPVTDAAAFDRGEAHLMWLGGRPETGGYKGYGLGLLVEVLGALLSGAGLGPAPEALEAAGTRPGRDDDIGFVALAVAPGALRPAEEFEADATSLFGSLLACPPLSEQAPVRYPGWHEAERARRHRADGVPLSASLHDELAGVARRLGLVPLTPSGEIGEIGEN